MRSTSALVAAPEWQAHAAALAAMVAEVADPGWAEAFAAVPRHVFIPRFFQRDADIGDLVAIEGRDLTRRRGRYRP